MNTIKKKIELKTHWAKVLDVHKAWLVSKGYTEKLLDSREPEGRLIERLKASITEAVANTLWVYRLEQFQIEISGRFDKKRDTVKFQFQYRLDPTMQRLSLVAMKASLGETMIEYPIARD